MLITKLQIKDIKNYTEQEFDFSNGIVAICGPNGSGKTTIIESIAWALFDHLDYKKEDFVRRGARKGSVNVFFVSTIDGREYAVSRDSTGSYYVYDPELKIRLAQQKQEVTKWLCQQHGVEDGTDLSNLFRTTIGVPQGSFTYDFLQPPSKRKPVFDKILKVEDYIHAADKFKDLSRLIEGKISVIREKIASDEGQLKHYEEIESNYHMAINKLASLKYLYDDALKVKDETETRLKHLEAFKEQLDRVNREISKLKINNIENETKEKNLIAEIQRAKQASELVNKAKAGYEKFLLASEKLKTLEKSRATRDQLRNSYSSTQQQISRLESDIEHTQQELKQIEKAHQELANLTTKVQEQEALEKQLQDLQKKVGEKEQVERNISNLGRDLDDLRQKYSEISRSIEDSEKHKNDDKLVTKLELEKSEIDERLANYNLTLAELKHKEEHLNGLINTYQNLDLQIKDISEETERLEKEVSVDLPSVTELEEKQKDLTHKIAELKAITQRDEKMQQEIKNGLCPLLSERCLNMKPGQTLDEYFSFQLTEQNTQLKEKESLSKTVSLQLTQARLLLNKKLNLESLISQLTTVKQQAASIKEQQNLIENELAKLGNKNDLLQSKTNDTSRLQALEKELTIARDGKLKYAQLEPRRLRLIELKEEGVQKRKAHDADSARLSRLKEELSAQAIIQTDLVNLGNPRVTYEGLKRQILRETMLKQQLSLHEQNYKRLLDETANLRNQLESFSTLDKELAEVNLLLADCQSDYQTFLANQSTASLLLKLEQDLEKIISNSSNLKAELEIKETELINISPKYSYEEHSEKRNLINKLIHEVAQLESESKHTETQKQNLFNQLERLTVVKREQTNKIAERDRLSELHDLADFIRDCLRKAGPYITEAYLYTVSLEANLLYREISGNSMISLRWGLDYEIIMEEEGRDRPFHNLSGGEQMTAAISVRLALLKEFSDLRFAFFDEPTTNMDEERRRNLAQQIGRIKEFEQLFIVTHDDSFEGFTDNIIQLTKKAHI